MKELPVFSAKAQIDIQVFKPKQLHKSTLANVATETMPKVDVATILAEEEKEKVLKGEAKGVFVFGKEIDANFSLSNSGTWFDTPKGRVWKLAIHSPKALSINLAFDKFRLPEGAKLLIYNQDSSMVMGPITSVVNNQRNAIATDLLSGDMTILELFEPIAQKGKTQLSIAKVVHGYKDALNHQHPIEISNGRTENYNSSASCNRDAVCEPTWSTESNGIVKITVLGASYSGALINDACQSWKPFFLTAKHNLDSRGVSQTQTWSVFTFRYRRTQCNNTSEAEPTGLFTLNGCTVRASWADTDFALYETNLSNQGYSVFSLQARNIHYLGWTRSTITPTSGASIHHPNGDVMKISLTNNITPSTQLGVSVWRAIWSSGITQSASSGGPLFDQNKRIIGQLFGGESSCANPLGSDTFGRFDQSWNGGGTPSTRLKDWLDPDNINPQYTNTALAGSSAVNPNIPSSSLLSVSGQGMTVTSSGLALAPIYNGSLITSTPNSQGILQAEWASNSSSVTISQSGITATAFPANGCVGGVASLRVRVRNCAGWSSWYFFTVNVCSSSGFRFVYSPNPTSDKLDITAEPTEDNKTFAIASSIDFEVKLIDKDGRVVREGKNLNKEKKITLDVKGLKEGTYFLHIAHGKEVEKHQIVVNKSASTN